MYIFALVLYWSVSTLYFNKTANSSQHKSIIKTENISRVVISYEINYTSFGEFYKHHGEFH